MVVDQNSDIPGTAILREEKNSKLQLPLFPWALTFPNPGQASRSPEAHPPSFECVSHHPRLWRRPKSPWH